MIVVLDIMLFGYDGMKRLVHAGECFKAFALTIIFALGKIKR